MDTKEAFSIIEKYGLSLREQNELNLAVLNEPPRNTAKRYEIKIRIIGEKITELNRQLDTVLKQHGLTRVSDCTYPEIIDLREAINELSLAQDIIRHEMGNNFWLR